MSSVLKCKTHVERSYFFLFIIMMKHECGFSDDSYLSKNVIDMHKLFPPRESLKLKNCRYINEILKTLTLLSIFLKLLNVF